MVGKGNKNKIHHKGGVWHGGRSRVNTHTHARTRARARTHTHIWQATVVDRHPGLEQLYSTFHPMPDSPSRREWHLRYVIQQARTQSCHHHHHQKTIITERTVWLFYVPRAHLSICRLSPQVLQPTLRPVFLLTPP